MKRPRIYTAITATSTNRKKIEVRVKLELHQIVQQLLPNENNSDKYVF